MINAEEFEPPLSEFLHQARDLPGCNFVIPDWIRRDVFRRERLRDESVMPRQNSAAFPMWLAAGMLQELPVYFAATTDGSVHFRVDTQLAAFCKELNRRRCGRSLLHEVHVTVPLQEFKITHPVKIILGAQFHFRVLDDLG